MGGAAGRRQVKGQEFCKAAYEETYKALPRPKDKAGSGSKLQGEGGVARDTFKGNVSVIIFEQEGHK